MKFEIGKKYKSNRGTGNIYLCLGFNTKGKAIFENTDGSVFFPSLDLVWQEVVAGIVFMNSYQYENGTIQHSVYKTYEEALDRAKGPYYIGTTKVEWEKGTQL